MVSDMFDADRKDLSAAALLNIVRGFCATGLLGDPSMLIRRMSQQVGANVRIEFELTQPLNLPSPP